MKNTRKGKHHTKDQVSYSSSTSQLMMGTTTLILYWDRFFFAYSIMFTTFQIRERARTITIHYLFDRVVQLVIMSL